MSCFSKEKLGQRSISALSEEPTMFGFIDSDLGILMTVIEHASLRERHRLGSNYFDPTYTLYGS